jgi:Putative abortive phage resistance protein AbiGi, antitoxin
VEIEMNKVGAIDPAWSDMSEYVVHFAKPHGGKTAYDCALSILYSRVIEARNSFGAGRHLPPARKSVCFSEVPLHQLKRLADVRGPYGVGFRKEFIVGRGGGPILYAYKDSDHAMAINSMVHSAKDEPDHPIWKVAPFVDLPGVYGKSQYLYEWEREWRSLGNFPFTVDDPAFLIIPEHLHSPARTFFDDAEAEHLGPNYKCKFIDPFWGEEKVASVIGG